MITFVRGWPQCVPKALLNSDILLFLSNLFKCVMNKSVYIEDDECTTTKSCYEYVSLCCGGHVSHRHVYSFYDVVVYYPLDDVS